MIASKSTDITDDDVFNESLQAILDDDERENEIHWPDEAMHDFLSTILFISSYFAKNQKYFWNTNNHFYWTSKQKTAEVKEATSLTWQLHPSKQQQRNPFYLRIFHNEAEEDVMTMKEKRSQDQDEEKWKVMWKWKKQSRKMKCRSESMRKIFTGCEREAGGQRWTKLIAHWQKESSPVEIWSLSPLFAFSIYCCSSLSSLKLVKLLQNETNSTASKTRRAERHETFCNSSSTLHQRNGKSHQLQKTNSNN